MLMRSKLWLLVVPIGMGVGVAACANPRQEMPEADFLDLVDQAGTVLVQGQGVDGVDARAHAQGLQGPALGYWSVEGSCFQRPSSGDCNGIFTR